MKLQLDWTYFDIVIAGEDAGFVGSLSVRHFLRSTGNISSKPFSLVFQAKI